MFAAQFHSAEGPWVTFGTGGSEYCRGLIDGHQDSTGMPDYIYRIVS